MSRPSASVCASSGSCPARARPSGTVQPVPDATDRLDSIAFGPEFGPEIVDVRIDGVGRDGDPERPGLIEELVTAESLARVPEQRFEQRELARGEVDRTIVDRDRPRRLVEADGPGDQARL